MMISCVVFFIFYIIFFFFNDTATTEIYTLSLHERSSDLRASDGPPGAAGGEVVGTWRRRGARDAGREGAAIGASLGARDRKSTRLNSSHANISYAVFCLKKKKNIQRSYICNEE